MIGEMEPAARRLAAAALAALVALVPAGASGGGGKALVVATWNLKWFGHPNAPRSSEALASMAAGISSRGVDVLALQEVAVTRLGPAGEPRSYAMDELVGILDDEHGQTWEYWIHKGKGDQHLGFMWRPESADLVASPLYGLKAQSVDNVLTGKKGEKKTVKKSPWYRTPVIAHVRSGEGLTDFTLVNVHLKAAEHQWGKDSFWETRRAECESLAEWIDGIWHPAQAAPPNAKPGKTTVPKGKTVPVLPAATKLFGVPFLPAGGKQVAQAVMKEVLSHVDPDLAVIGDFNAPVHVDMDAEPLTGLGMHFLGTDQPTHSGGAALDRILVSVPMGEEHALSQGGSSPGQAFAVGQPGVGGSDHAMVSFTVAVRPDDD
jgi:endonuclease/exonuclease/phosphatase family metal-dependent hydrolase